MTNLYLLLLLLRADTNDISWNWRPDDFRILNELIFTLYKDIFSRTKSSQNTTIIQVPTSLSVKRRTCSFMFDKIIQVVLVAAIHKVGKLVYQNSSVCILHLHYYHLCCKVVEAKTSFFVSKTSVIWNLFMLCLAALPRQISWPRSLAAIAQQLADSYFLKRPF